MIVSKLVDALGVYGRELPSLNGWLARRNNRTCFPRTGMLDWLEAQCLYLLIRQSRPKVVWEISPNYGYSTGYILQAMNRNECGALYSFDLTSRVSIVAHMNFKRNGIDYERQKYVVGDARKTWQSVAEKDIDLLFMDSDHSYEFGRWYMKDLIPLVKSGGLIHVHDVLRYGSRPHLGDLGEGRALWEYIQENRIPEEYYIYLAELRDRLPVDESPLRELQVYPPDLRATNNTERSASFWMVKG